MAVPDRKSIWQRVRRPFRWCRITLWSILLLLLGCFLYFSGVGLPDFLKQPLVAELSARGIDLEFSRLRFRWFRGLVAESVTVGQRGLANGIEFSAAEIAIKLDPEALGEFRPGVQALVIENGQLVVPAVTATDPLERLVIDKVATEIQLLPDDRWEIERFEAICLGARITAHGSLTNASAMRARASGQDGSNASASWGKPLVEVVKLAKSLRFSRPPRVNLVFRGDARKPAELRASLTVDAQNAQTRWGRLDQLLLIARVNQLAPTGGVARSELRLQLDHPSTPWLRARSVLVDFDWNHDHEMLLPYKGKCSIEMSGVETPWGTVPKARFAGTSVRVSTDPFMLRTALSLQSGTLESDWIQFETNRLTARLLHSPIELLPREAEWEWIVDQPRSRWGTAEQWQLDGRMRQATGDAPALDTADWGWWAALAPFELDASARVSGIAATNLAVQRLSLDAEWRPPFLRIPRLEARLYDRKFEGRASVDAGTREAEAGVQFDFDVHRVEDLLTPAARRWLSQFQWDTPPEVEGRVRARLPAWTNSHPDWRVEVQPTLVLEGGAKSGRARFRGVPVDSAHTHFHYSNQVWTLPDFVGVRPEGRFEFLHRANDRTREFYFKVRSEIDPLALKPLLGNVPPQALQLFELTSAPKVEGEVWGRWRAPESIGFNATLQGGNFRFRGEAVDDFKAALQYTNGFFSAGNIAIQSGEQWVTADGVGYDIARARVHLTNAASSMDPARIARVIGSNVVRVMKPYQFLQPPMARANGWIEVRRAREADIRFDVAGGPFRYWKFNLPRIETVVLWLNENVTLTNTVADFYGGRLTGDVFVDCSPRKDANFRFQASVIDADLKLLMRDLVESTNQLAGTLSGNLIVTRANSGDWGSWQGSGDARLRDGFLWDIPLFGVFTPVLEGLMPGVASGKLAGGTATFQITNSVIRTEDMELRSPAMRLAYRGTVDFAGNLDARAEAQLLRDLWGIGPVVSLVFTPLTKLFEYRITGTLAAPEREPLFIPKPFMLPFAPVKTLKDLFTPDAPGALPVESPPPPQGTETPE